MIDTDFQSFITTRREIDPAPLETRLASKVDRAFALVGGGRIAVVTEDEVSRFISIAGGGALFRVAAGAGEGLATDSSINGAMRRLHQLFLRDLECNRTPLWVGRNGQLALGRLQFGSRRGDFTVGLAVAEVAGDRFDVPALVTPERDVLTIGDWTCSEIERIDCLVLPQRAAWFDTGGRGVDVYAQLEAAIDGGA